jgi:hypothetical protein
VYKTSKITIAFAHVDTESRNRALGIAPSRGYCPGLVASFLIEQDDIVGNALNYLRRVRTGGA